MQYDNTIESRVTPGLHCKIKVTGSTNPIWFYMTI